MIVFHFVAFGFLFKLSPMLLNLLLDLFLFLDATACAGKPGIKVKIDTGNFLDF